MVLETFIVQVKLFSYYLINYHGSYPLLFALKRLLVTHKHIINN
jgi:hypothetical protein